MNKEKRQLTKIGFIGKTHGIMGELNARLTIDLEELILKKELTQIFFFLEIDALPVPFLLKSFRQKGDNLYLIQFEDYNKKELAEKLTNLPILLDTQLIPEDSHFSPQHFINFSLLNDKEEPIGNVVDIDDSTLNLLFFVELQNKEIVAIPIADELIQYIDVEQNIISVIIPEGLIEEKL